MKLITSTASCQELNDLLESLISGLDWSSIFGKDQMARNLLKQELFLHSMTFEEALQLSSYQIAFMLLRATNKQLTRMLGILPESMSSSVDLQAEPGPEVIYDLIQLQEECIRAMIREK